MKRIISGSTQNTNKLMLTDTKVLNKPNYSLAKMTFKGHFAAYLSPALFLGNWDNLQQQNNRVPASNQSSKGDQLVCSSGRNALKLSLLVHMFHIFPANSSCVASPRQVVETNFSHFLWRI